MPAFSRARRTAKCSPPPQHAHLYARMHRSNGIRIPVGEGVVALLEDDDVGAIAQPGFQVTADLLDVHRDLLHGASSGDRTELRAAEKFPARANSKNASNRNRSSANGGWAANSASRSTTARSTRQLGFTSAAGCRAAKKSLERESSRCMFSHGTPAELRWRAKCRTQSASDRSVGHDRSRRFPHRQRCARSTLAACQATAGWPHTPLRHAMRAQ